MDEKPIRLTKWVQGQTNFLAWGVSTIKIGDSLVEIPIRSIGIVEAREAIEASAPRPPEKELLVRKDSGLGRQLDLERDTPMIALNAADPGYQKALAEHNQAIMWHTLARAIDADFVTEDGTVVKNPEEIISILKASGLSGHHLDQLMTDITVLTKRREALADFLSGAGSGAQTPSSTG